jgi:hypothetical protein
LLFENICIGRRPGYGPEYSTYPAIKPQPCSSYLPAYYSLWVIPLTCACEFYLSPHTDFLSYGVYTNHPDFTNKSSLDKENSHLVVLICPSISTQPHKPIESHMFVSSTSGKQYQRCASTQGAKLQSCGRSIRHL